ncbi:MAG: hypothetical protein KDA41_11045, partial [Planctomycetales bacterium]|nr:hypothetical protein [Planctomycetales bacterium]
MMPIVGAVLAWSGASYLYVPPLAAVIGAMLTARIAIVSAPMRLNDARALMRPLLVAVGALATGALVGAVVGPFLLAAPLLIVNTHSVKRYIDTEFTNADWFMRGVEASTFLSFASLVGAVYGAIGGGIGGLVGSYWHVIRRPESRHETAADLADTPHNSSIRRAIWTPWIRSRFVRLGLMAWLATCLAVAVVYGAFALESRRAWKRMDAIGLIRVAS